MLYRWGCARLLQLSTVCKSIDTGKAWSHHLSGSIWQFLHFVFWLIYMPTCHRYSIEYSLSRDKTKYTLRSYMHHRGHVLRLAWQDPATFAPEQNSAIPSLQHGIDQSGCTYRTQNQLKHKTMYRTLNNSYLTGTTSSQVVFLLSTFTTWPYSGLCSCGIQPTLADVHNIVSGFAIASLPFC